MPSKRTVYATSTLGLGLAALYIYSLGDHAILLAYLLVWPAVLLFGAALLGSVAWVLARIEEYRLLSGRD